jgi:hypothetical protein
MSDLHKLTPEEAAEIFNALEEGPGAKVPLLHQRALKKYEEHKRVAAPDCACLQCEIDRGEVSA